MIQRVQSLYLLIAAVLLAIVPAVAVVAVAGKIVAGAASLVEFITIFLYKNRKLQMRLCVAAELLIIVYFILLAVGKAFPLRAVLLPLLSLLGCIFAFRAVCADERLVRSADRLR